MFFSVKAPMFCATIALFVVCFHQTTRVHGLEFQSNITLRSEKTKQYVRVKASSVDANGNANDPDAKLALLTVSQTPSLSGGQLRVSKGSADVRIGSRDLSRFLCFSTNGILKVLDSSNRDSSYCRFKEDVYKTKIRKYSSAANNTWYIGFGRTGKPRSAKQLFKQGQTNAVVFTIKET